MTLDAYKQLVSDLNRHAKAYYVDNQPVISDEQYDSLYHQALAYETKFPEHTLPESPTQRVGDVPLEAFQPFIHAHKMYSLGNAFGQEDMLDFIDRVQKGLQLSNQTIPFVMQPKIDGLAVSLRYENGYFVKGGTRGDGQRGEDVTENLKTIRTLPLKLAHPVTIDVRGEVYLRRSVFETFDDEYVNPRNSASGALRQLDPSVTSQKRLDFFAYQVIGSSDMDSEYDQMQWLDQLGFQIIPFVKKTDSVSTMMQYFEALASEKEQFDFDVDGAVVKVDSDQAQQKLGFTSKTPRWAIAYKYKTEEVETIIEDVTFQVGRTGIVTPVAELAPVMVSGAMVRRATLHNEDEIEKKEVSIGDTVLVRRAGEVIPEVIRSVKKHAGSRAIVMPSQCPVCEGPVTREEGEAAYRCRNVACIAQLKGKLKHMVARGAFDVRGFGDALIDQAVDIGVLTNLSDLFYLSEDDIYKLDNMAEKRVSNILAAIETSKTISLSRFIYGLGLPFVGKHVAEVFASNFLSIDAFASASLETLQHIHEVGEKTAQAVYDAFRQPEFLAQVKRIQDSGFLIQADAPTEGKYSGKRFLFTGALSLMTRTEAQEKAKAQGAKIVSAVSKQLDVLVVGDKPGSKLKKAQAINDSEDEASIVIMTEAEFVADLAEH